MSTSLQWAGSNGHHIVSKILHTPVHYYLVFSYVGQKHTSRPHHTASSGAEMDTIVRIRGLKQQGEQQRGEPVTSENPTTTHK